MITGTDEIQIEKKNFGSRKTLTRPVVFNLGSANDFKGAKRAKRSVRGPQYRCLIIINVF